MKIKPEHARAEENAYKQLLKVAGGKSLFKPAGFDPSFPDFGFRVFLESGKKIDIHVEYKANYLAQMGSMRDWRFNGTRFYTKDTNNVTKSDLVLMMNKTSEAMKNAKRILTNLQTYVHRGIKELYGGSLTAVKDKKERLIKAKAFAEATEYRVAHITSSSLGNLTLQHYKTKFHKNLKSGSDASVLLMMLKDKVWLVDTYGQLSAREQDEVANILGAKRLRPLNSLTANLECRIQPKNLKGTSAAATIDMMANFRLTKAPSGGVKVI